MDTEPNDETMIDPRLRVASLIADTRQALAELGEVSALASEQTRAAHIEALLAMLADAAAAAIAEPVSAVEVLPGDVLVVDGAEITVASVPRPGMYTFGDARRFGWAIDWRAGETKRGTMFRLPLDTLCRLPRELAGQSAPGGGR